mmetsp:Transcript_22706/g.73023  ORF Transcript_22706/g.73023 Transcript_22706/m.73023 type:complete len:361 (-) Transcript_22706:28-1110(-)
MVVDGGGLVRGGGGVTPSFCRCWGSSSFFSILISGIAAAQQYSGPPASAGRTWARQYDGADCRRALREANLTRWQLSTTSPKKQKQRPVGWDVQEVMEVRVNGVDVLFVRDQKVASAYLWESPIHEVLGVDASRVTRYAKKVVPFASVRTDAVVVAFVREPWAHLLSGYMEVLGRARHLTAYGAETYGPAEVLERRACDDEEGRYGLFKQFLRDLDDGRDLSIDAFHVWPQALLIDAIAPSPQRRGRRFDFIGQMDTMEDTFTDLRVAVGLPANRTVLTRPRHRHSHRNQKDYCHVDRLPVGDAPYADDDTTQRFCRLFDVDYLCFPFPAPLVCTDLWASSSGGLALGERRRRRRRRRVR